MADFFSLHTCLAAQPQKYKTVIEAPRRTSRNKPGQAKHVGRQTTSRLRVTESKEYHLNELLPEIRSQTEHPHHSATLG